ncbi:MAG: hypothetical protein JZD41_01825 [Thermoproteus sp.]|nr:hypothetical protein [Thermoproteus sp.]
MSVSLNVKVGFAVLKNDDCSITGYRLGADPDQLLYQFVKHCLSQKQDLCTSKEKYSIAPLHQRAIEEV